MDKSIANVWSWSVDRNWNQKNLCTCAISNSRANFSQFPHRINLKKWDNNLHTGSEMKMFINVQLMESISIPSIEDTIAGISKFWWLKIFFFRITIKYFRRCGGIFCSSCCPDPHTPEYYRLCIRCEPSMIFSTIIISVIIYSLDAVFLSQQNLREQRIRQENMRHEEQMRHDQMNHSHHHHHHHSQPFQEVCR